MTYQQIAKMMKTAKQNKVTQAAKDTGDAASAVTGYVKGQIKDKAKKVEGKTKQLIDNGATKWSNLMRRITNKMNKKTKDLD